MAHHSGGTISCIATSLIFNNCLFTMTPNSNPPPVGGILYYDAYSYYNEFAMNNVTFDAQKFKQTTSLATFISSSFQTFHVTMLCSQSFKTLLRILNSTLTTYISCTPSCFQGYTFQSGNMTLNGQIGRDLLTDPSAISCFHCPVGATCDAVVNALPNYWGYRNQTDFVTMLRCPEGYCCTNNDTCKGIDSCNTGRAGVLCGSCEANWTESLFST